MALVERESATLAPALPEAERLSWLLWITVTCFSVRILTLQADRPSHYILILLTPKFKKKENKNDRIS
jgi:hypothetical protein